MRGDPAAKKGVLRPLARPVVKLRGQEHIARRIFFLQTADRGHANDPAHVQGTERIDVGAMIQFVRENAMPAAVARQKIHLPAVQLRRPMIASDGAPNGVSI